MGDYQPRYGVPCLKGKHLLNAQYRGLLKYDRVYPDLTPHRKMYKWVLKEIERVIVSTKVHSVDEVVSRLNLKTSCGYPFNKWYSTKEEFLKLHDINLLMDWYYRDIADFDGPLQFWGSFLKEEIRLFEKLKEGSIRQVNGCNMLYLIALSRFTLDYNDQFIKNWKILPSAVGFNPLSVDWDFLMKQKEQYRKHLSVDTVKWDASMAPCAWKFNGSHRANLLIRGGASLADCQLFMRLYMQVPFAYVLMPDGYIYLTNGGNKSGSPVTTEDNTVHNHAITVITFDALGISKEEFGENSDDRNFGDDKHLSHNFDVTFADLAEKYKELFDLEITNEAISEDLLDTSFCSRVPIKLGGLYFSKAKDGHKALDSMFLANDDLDPKARYQRACGLRIAYFFNEEAYKPLTAYCQFLLTKYGQPTPEWRNLVKGFLTKEEIFRIYLHEENSQGSFKVVPGEEQCASPCEKFVMSSQIQKKRNKRKRQRKMARKNQPMTKVRQRRPRNRQNSRVRRGTLAGELSLNRSGLSGCARDYLVQLCDPFIPRGACVPIFPCLDSEKTHVFLKGQMVTSGATGIGFVAVAPVATHDSSANPSFAWFTDSTFSGNSLNANRSATGVTSLPHNGPFTGTQFADGEFKYRPVSLGLKIKYAGTKFYEGGSLVLLEEPDHGNLFNFDMSELLAYDACRNEKVSEDWHTITMSPVDMDEVKYFNFETGSSGYYWGGEASVANQGVIPLAVMVRSALSPANDGTYIPLQFDFEVHADFEVIGTIARGKTASDIDVLGQQTVAGLVQKGKEAQKTPKQILQTAGVLLKDFGSRAATQLSNAALASATAAIGNLF